MKQRIGLLTGSFDPVTLGHMDMIARASQMFDKVYVGVFYNIHKAGLVPVELRAKWLQALVAKFGNVEVVTSSDALVVEVARRYQATHLVRGLRNMADFEYEASLDFYNRQLAEEIETIYLMAKPELKFVSSSGVRELLRFGADVSSYVPQEIIEELENVRCV